MVNRPSVPEIITVNSEELQAVIRDLLPSQNGFGSELQASNIITPIIDLTASAEGSRLPTSLQQAFDFGTTNATATNNTVTLINQTGFWRCFFSFISVSNNNQTGTVQINDGSSTTTIFEATQLALSGAVFTAEAIIFLAAGQSIELVAGASSNLVGSCRQVATVDGTLVNPLGFSPT
jgi:hypothetical protein